MESLKIQNLKVMYAGKLSVKAAELRELTQALRNGNSNPSEATEELHDYLHKLAGSSGMYGYDDILLAAQQAMDTLTAVDHTTEFAALERLQDLLEQYA